MQKRSIVYFRSNKLKPRISKRIKSADVYGAQIISKLNLSIDMNLFLFFRQEKSFVLTLNYTFVDITHSFVYQL